jgi:hypothetical protein
MESLTFARKPDPAVASADPGGLRVRLRENAAGSPLTRVEGATLEILKESGETRLDLLAGRVASELYHEELRNGAWAVDLGLLGSGLFIPAVMRSLKAYNGILWQIVDGSGNKDGVLSDLR